MPGLPLKALDGREYSKAGIVKDLEARLSGSNGPRLGTPSNHYSRGLGMKSFNGAMDCCPLIDQSG